VPAETPAVKRRVPNKERRGRSEHAILRSAEELFVANGFYRTTIDEIAQKAGLTKGSVYFHFADKEQLLLALLTRAERRVMAPILASMDEEGVEPKLKIIRYLNSWARAAVEQRNTMFLPILMSFEFLGSGAVIEQHITASYDRAYDSLSRVFAEGQRSGDIPAFAPPREQAAVLIGLADGMLLEWLRRGTRLDGLAASQAIRSLVMSGLSIPEPAAASLAVSKNTVPFDIT